MLLFGLVWTLVPIVTTSVVGGSTLIISSEAVDLYDHLDTLPHTPNYPKNQKYIPIYFMGHPGEHFIMEYR